jgi:hypothetical protein
MEAAQIYDLTRLRVPQTLSAPDFREWVENREEFELVELRDDDSADEGEME